MLNINKCEQVDVFFNNVTMSIKSDEEKNIEIGNFLKCIKLHKYPYLLPNIFENLNINSKLIFGNDILHPGLRDVLSVMFLYKDIQEATFFDMLPDKIKTNIFGVLFLEYQVHLSSDRYNNDKIINNLKYILSNYCDSIDICSVIDDKESLDDFIILLKITNIKNSRICIGILYQLYKSSKIDGVNDVLSHTFSTKYKIASNVVMYGIYRKMLKKKRGN